MDGGKLSKRVKKNVKRHRKILFVLGIILLQACFSVFQASRYGDVDATGNSYRCVEMSRDSERFFELLGIHVYQVRGSKFEVGIEGNIGNITGSHRWILLDFGIVAIPFESTALVFFNPEWCGFEHLKISEGYVVDSVYYNNETNMEWSEWK